MAGPWKINFPLRDVNWSRDDPLFKFGTPSLSGTDKAIDTSSLVCGWIVATNSHRKIHRPLRGHGQRHVANLLNLGTPVQCLSSSLVHRWTVASTGQRKIGLNCLLRRRGIRHVTLFKICDLFLLHGTGEDRHFQFGMRIFALFFHNNWARSLTYRMV